MGPGARCERHRAGGHAVAHDRIARLVGRHLPERARHLPLAASGGSIRDCILVGRRLDGALSQHRDQGARGHRRAKHLRVRLRRVQPSASAGDARGSTAGGVPDDSAASRPGPRGASVGFMAKLVRRRKLMGEINVVPYIDVMLVLLVIFMITAPLLKEGVKVDLPAAGAKPIDPGFMDKHPPLIVTIDSSGRLFINLGPNPHKPPSEPTVRPPTPSPLPPPPPP